MSIAHTLSILRCSSMNSSIIMAYYCYYPYANIWFIFFFCFCFFFLMFYFWSLFCGAWTETSNIWKGSRQRVNEDAWVCVPIGFVQFEFHRTKPRGDPLGLWVPVGFTIAVLQLPPTTIINIHIQSCCCGIQWSTRPRVWEVCCGWWTCA